MQQFPNQGISLSVAVPDLFHSLSVRCTATLSFRLLLIISTYLYFALYVPLYFQIVTTKQTNCRALVRQRTIPTERPPLVGEVILLVIFLVSNPQLVPIYQ
jgi:hypothetical protein